MHALSPPCIDVGAVAYGWILGVRAANPAQKGGLSGTQPGAQMIQHLAK